MDQYLVGIVVDAEFGDRVLPLLTRLPVWLADTPLNRTTAENVWRNGPVPDHTEIGALTLFTVDASEPPESWCRRVLVDVDLHHGPLSHDPGYAGLEVFGASLIPSLGAALTEYGLTTMSAFAGGFRVTTPDGMPVNR